MTRAHPTGRQYEIRSGTQRAVITEVGATLRNYWCDGVALLDGFGDDEMSTPARGCTLIPWPNRIAGGRYTWDGNDHQLPLNEPGNDSALHGLVRFANWSATRQGPDAVTMTLRLHAQDGYPFVLDLSMTYAVGADGLTVTAGAVNAGSRAAPYGYGAHPYLTVGTERIDDAVLQVPAGSYLRSHDAGVPAGRASVAGTAHDLRAPCRIGEAVMDHAFTELERDAGGRAWVSLSGGDDGRALRLWVDEAVPYVHVFTGDTVPDVRRRRRSVAIEPMTCPPNAFRSGQDVRRLEPGEKFVCRWGIAATGI